MANHHVTIAKATFAASLLRPDVTKISRDEVPQFHLLLETAIIKCSPSNIQKCKQWLVANILPSTQRTSAFARYLTAFARHVQHSDDEKRCSNARQRLHILYVLNDLLHHAKHHAPNAGLYSIMVQTLQPTLLDLVRQAAIDGKKHVCRRLEDLLSLWQESGYFAPELIRQAKEVIEDPSVAETAEKPPTTSSSAATKELPFVMPSSHGDSSLPFYELPAGNLMPHIIPNKAIPMRPESIKPLQFASGPADESLANAVRDFLKDVGNIDNEYDLLDDANLTAEVDDLGQISHRNEAGDVLGDTYYGWSRAFCEKMKARGKKDTNGDTMRSMSRSSSISRSPSRSPRKRRRYSDSGSQISRSARSYSRSRSRDKVARFRPVDKSRSRSRSPPPARVPNFMPAKPQTPQSARPSAHQYQPPTASLSSHAHFSPSIQPPSHPPPFAPGGMPVPPPRPPHWQGPWPPPPPPPPPAVGGLPFPPQPPSFGRQNPGPPAGPRNGYGQYR